MAQTTLRRPSKCNTYRAALARLRPVLIGVAGISALINALMLTGSVYMLQIYDRVLSSGSVPTLLGLFGIVVLLYVFLGVYDFLRARILARASIRLDQALAGDVCQAYLRAGVPGAQSSRATGASTQPLRDLDTMRGFLGSPAMQGLFDIPFTPLFLAVLFFVHPWLGLLTIAGSTIVAGATLLNRFISRGHMERTLALDSAARDFADSGKRGIEACIAMGMDRTLTARWQDMHEAALAAGQRSSDPAETLTAFSKAFRMLLQSAILTLGAYLVLGGEISAGMIIASSILSGRALAPIDQAIGQLRAITGARAAHKRLHKFFAAQQLEAQTRMDLPRPTGHITVNGLTKLAPGLPRPDRARLITHVGFALAPGDGLGVIGNSASGKSTLARLLVGAWQADSGEIRLDGATLDQWDNTALGHHIGYMPQTLDLLPGTVRENIARFDTEATSAKVIAAAKMAGVHEMILQLEHGYNTRIGGAAGNTALSGGQVQRLGLARAVYGNPAIVVLDEPNANLDADGDEALCAAVLTLRKAGTTVIVMAHRPSAIAAVNKVLVMQHGTVAHFGDKAEVMDTLRAATMQVVPNVPVTQTPPAPQSMARPVSTPEKPVTQIPQVCASSEEADTIGGANSTANLKKLFAVERSKQKAAVEHSFFQHQDMAKQA